MDWPELSTDEKPTIIPSFELFIEAVTFVGADGIVSFLFRVINIIEITNKIYLGGITENGTINFIKYR